MNNNKNKKFSTPALFWLFLAGLGLMSSPVSSFNANELLALKKIETYITNATHLIDEAEGMERDGERYKFHYYGLRQDLTDIAKSVRRFINQNKKNQTPRNIVPLVKEY